MKLTKLLEKEQRWKNAKRRGRFWRDIGDINPEKDARMSDNGAGARRIFAACDNLQDEENAWLNAFYDAIDRLPPAEITIVRALMCDFRSGSAARLANVSRYRVNLVKNKLVTLLEDARKKFNHRFGGQSLR